MADYVIQAGDNMPLRVTLRRATGRAIPLGAPGPNQSLVDLVFRGAAPGLHADFTSPCVVLEGTVIPPGDEAYDPGNPARLFGEGVVEYVWGVGETLIRGLYRLGFRITTVALDVETVPNEGAFDLRIE